MLSHFFNVATVCVSAALLQLEGGGTLLAAVQALGCSCAIEKQPLPRSVSWMRRTPCAQVITHTLTLFSHCCVLVKVKYEYTCQISCDTLQYLLSTDKTMVIE